MNMRENAWTSVVKREVRTRPAYVSGRDRERERERERERSKPSRTWTTSSTMRDCVHFVRAPTEGYIASKRPAAELEEEVEAEMEARVAAAVW